MRARDLDFGVHGQGFELGVRGLGSGLWIWGTWRLEFAVRQGFLVFKPTGHGG